MLIVIYVHFQPTCNKNWHTKAKILARILVSPLEHQMSWSDTNDEVVDHYYSLAYASKQGKWHSYAPDTKHHEWCRG